MSPPRAWWVALVSRGYAQAWVLEMALGGIGLQVATEIREGDIVRVGFPPHARAGAFVVAGSVRHVRAIKEDARWVGVALDGLHDAECYRAQLQACCTLGDGV